MPEKRIVIPKKELDEDLLPHVEHIRTLRGLRIAIPLNTAMFNAIPYAPYFQPHTPTEHSEILALRAIIHLTTLPLATLSIVGGGHNIAKTVEELSTKLNSRAYIDKGNKHLVSKLAETHPWFFLNHRGDLVFVPKSKFQEGLARAQKTFWKHVIPFRYRGKVTE